MEKVEQNRNFYPMTFYPESLTIISKQLNPELSNNKFILETLPITIRDIHYINELKLRRFQIGLLSLIALIISLAIYYITRNLIVLSIIFTSLLGFLGYLSLENKINKIKNQLLELDRKIINREYNLKFSFIPQNPSHLLINSLATRESIYDFEIDESAKKGIAEAYFLTYLKKWFQYPWRILEHCKFGAERYTPTADFILINNDFNLGLDIEIDEPYTLKELQPIHLVENRQYIVRDKFFLELGCIVVRFAEYQIAKYPDYCCLHIARILNQYLESSIKISIPDSTEIVPLKPEQWKVKSWTFREAQIMANDKVRDQYLEAVKNFNSLKPEQNTQQD
ncbi:MAG: hypothetical protein RLZZ574_1946 [Cyanobacteriota bacterium]